MQVCWHSSPYSCFGNTEDGIFASSLIGDVVLHACYTNNGVVYEASKSVSVIKGVKNLSIYGEGQIYCGDSTRLSGVVVYDDGTSDDLSSRLSLSDSDSAILSMRNGVASADGEEFGNVVLSLEYVYNGRTYTTKKELKVIGEIRLSSDDSQSPLSLTVPVSWINRYSQYRTSFGTDLSASLTKPTGKCDSAGKALSVWHDYVVGTDPTDVNDVFKAKIDMEDGVPQISWEPNLNESGTERQYKVYGRSELGCGDWEWPADASKHKFFRVSVDMPEDDASSDSPGDIWDGYQVVSVPKPYEDLFYTGSAISGFVPAVGYELSNAVATDAGTYVATATLKDKYKWDDGSLDDKHISWSILQATNRWVTEPSLSSTEVYVGETVSVDAGKPLFGTAKSNYSAANIAELPAGSYVFKSWVDSSENYQGLTNTVAFRTIESNVALIPVSEAGLVYNGSSQYGVKKGTGYTLSNYVKTAAGNYVAVATLSEGYVWEDGTSEAKQIPWSIAKATNEWRTLPYITPAPFEEGSAVSIVTGGTARFGSVVVNYTRTSLAQLVPGEYTLTCTVAETANYTGLSYEVPFTVLELPIEKKTYCVIDLSGGSEAERYPVSYLADVPSGGWTDAYKKTKLVLRRVEAGSFQMAGTCNVTLTKPYYVGVFELTQAQYKKIMGTSHLAAYYGDCYPVQYLKWNEVRGDSSTYDWPTSAAVGENSVVGILRSKTGLEFDLPTEAQWEYASRAGTTTAYNNGKDTTKGLALIARCSLNSFDTSVGVTNGIARVGSYLPNNWGLYDMHGNIAEMCLDRQSAAYNQNDDLADSATNPVGASSGTSLRVVRGGDWTSNPKSGFLSNLYRWSGVSPSESSSHSGCRLIWRAE